MGVPLAGAFLMGAGSLGLVYVHLLTFDYLRSMGYSNVEVISHRVFEAVPPLRYLIYTPLSLHHREKDSNFCLFMPLFDLLGGTLNSKSWELQKEIYKGTMIGCRSSCSWCTWWTSCRRCTSRSCCAPSPRCRSRTTSSCSPSGPWPWSTGCSCGAAPRPSSSASTTSAAASTRPGACPATASSTSSRPPRPASTARSSSPSSAQTGWASRSSASPPSFVDKHPDLRVRVVHGNTLTAAVILNEIPSNTKEVFLTGATSKLGRAIALYLCRKRIRVMVPYLSRFLKIQREAPAEFQQYLVQVTKYQAAQNCKTWIVGKWLSPREQRWAPPGTHFHQFVVPPIIGFRRDCTYGKLAAMRLPKMERGVVHACHAGGVVHFLEGWEHHEVGALDVDRIDVVWKAALKHGLTPV
ncbi:unnamed protein product [Triticum turgidum subsp. durum]|uniref:Very-long-chain aldehyde decarbonylase CER1-like C-terminal domain-containing protein n=1 Tax=Triticum turgidum subsp. durum TaxID=4567 RepID=A0A9R1B982_TRITD|nr:unnamed protein product [Triticum turgidum subsp. durum]